MSSTILNVGLLGAGRIAGVHATAISTNPGSRLVAVSDINPPLPKSSRPNMVPTSARPTRSSAIPPSMPC